MSFASDIAASTSFDLHLSRGTANPSGIRLDVL
jgi:hypothetical protein